MPAAATSLETSNLLARGDSAASQATERTQNKNSDTRRGARTRIASRLLGEADRMANYRPKYENRTSQKNLWKWGQDTILRRAVPIPKHDDDSMLRLACDVHAGSPDRACRLGAIALLRFDTARLLRFAERTGGAGRDEGRSLNAQLASTTHSWRSRRKAPSFWETERMVVAGGSGLRSRRGFRRLWRADLRRLCPFDSGEPLERFS